MTTEVKPPGDSPFFVTAKYSVTSSTDESSVTFTRIRIGAPTFAEAGGTCCRIGGGGTPPPPRGGLSPKSQKPPGSLPPTPAGVVPRAAFLWFPLFCVEHHVAPKSSS